MMPVRRNANWLPGIFNDFFGNEWLQKSAVSTPAVNIFETEEDYRIEVAAPGLTQDDFEIKIDGDNELVASIQKEEERKEGERNGRYLRCEFTQSRFQQRTILPDGVEKEKIRAKVENGVLTIDISERIEVREKPSTRKIEYPVAEKNRRNAKGVARKSGAFFRKFGKRREGSGPRGKAMPFFRRCALLPIIL